MNINIPPRPSSLIESMRDIGYSLDTAIADIIDNSITANASNIHVRFSWNNSNPWVAIIDDGYGMSNDELIEAMRFVSKNPLDERNKADLGRFGLGLKTASISQCRSLTVLSVKVGETNATQWDLDYLEALNHNNWSLKLLSCEDIRSHQVLFDLKERYLANRESGTIVFWDKLDKLGEGTSKLPIENQFNEALFNVRKHLELVFHRFLSPNIGNKKINIFFNENKIDAYDPFNSSNSSELHSEEFLYEGERIHVQPYVLPHHNKVTKDEWSRYSGNTGYLNEQGFYVYRNYRLIISGTWFRLIPKSELTKLVRVRVDIPNSLDHLWRIDVKKSNAFPPAGIREKLKRIISKIELAGKRVYKQRGQNVSSESKVPGWKRIARENEIFYEINKEHPLIVKLHNIIEEPEKKLFDSILTMLEGSFPRDAYFNDIATSPENVNTCPLDKEQLTNLLKYFILESNKQIDKNKLQIVLQTEPFVSNREATELIFKERGYDYES